MLMIYFFTSGIYKVFIYTPLTKSISPNMENVIIIKDKEAFLFGSNPVKLTFKKTGINGILNFKNYKTEIYNDGATLSLYNTNIKWINNKAIITLRGSEQLDKIIEVDFKKNISYSISQ